MKIERQKRNIQWEWGIIIDDMTPEEEQEYIQNKTNEIKQSFQDEIFTRYSQTDQANMTARVTEINTLCMFEKREPTADELLDIQKAQDMIEWIRQKRLECSILIAEVIE